MGSSQALNQIRGFDRFMVRLKRRYAPSKVLLFGSRARAEHLATSDVDLLIVSDAFEGIPWRLRLQLVVKMWDGDVALEPLCYTETEFQRRSKEISIIREAARTGVALRI
ncbi:MAG TPA: nucleotidyltransferase domain-containing protein [Candidatus Thermoplasmatota archaeon]|nr:nucleotidyltransferase domain-containing protein [Candidatus Thermoplasmatota archaeon]